MFKGTGVTYKPEIYPAYTFRASPTFFAWVKLPATDIHELRQENGFQGQNLYFHLNHPIRFICVTAPIVSIEDLFSKFILLTLDDGSGATIAAKIKRLDKDVVEKHSVELASNTVVSNVNVSTGVGLKWAFDVQVDGVSIDVGTVVKVKGTIEEFRNVKQIDVKGLKVLRSTADEVREWADLARWKADVLGRPWYLGKRKLKELQEADQAEARRRADEERAAREREQRRVKRRNERREKMQRHEDKREMMRRKEEIMFNHGALI